MAKKSLGSTKRGRGREVFHGAAGDLLNGGAAAWAGAEMDAASEGCRVKEETGDRGGYEIYGTMSSTRQVAGHGAQSRGA